MYSAQSTVLEPQQIESLSLGWIKLTGFLHVLVVDVVWFFLSPWDSLKATNI